MKVPLLRISLGIFCLLLVASYAFGEAPSPAYIEVSPNFLTANSGELHEVYVTVLDQDRNPLPNILVSAKSSLIGRVSLEPDSAMTDENGKVVFTVRGIYFPGAADITFTAGEISESISTVWIYL